MKTFAHPLVSASLAVITCAVLIGNAVIELRSKNTSFPEYKPRPTLSEKRQHTRMIGNWLGESPVQSGGQRRVLLRQFPDGTFKVTFKTRRQGESITAEQQVGQWGVAGPVYFTITTGWVNGGHVEPTDLGQPYFYDAYRIVRFEEDYLEFESYMSKQKYILRRVADDFSEDDL